MRRSERAIRPLPNAHPQIGGGRMEHLQSALGAPPRHERDLHAMRALRQRLLPLHEPQGLLRVRLEVPTGRACFPANDQRVVGSDGADSPPAKAGRGDSSRPVARDAHAANDASSEARTPEDRPRSENGFTPTPDSRSRSRGDASVPRSRGERPRRPPQSRLRTSVGASPGRRGSRPGGPIRWAPGGSDLASLPIRGGPRRLACPSAGPPRPPHPWDEWSARATAGSRRPARRARSRRASREVARHAGTTAEQEPHGFVHATARGLPGTAHELPVRRVGAEPSCFAVSRRGPASSLRTSLSSVSQASRPLWIRSA